MKVPPFRIQDEEEIVKIKSVVQTCNHLISTLNIPLISSRYSKANVVEYVYVP